MAQFLGIDYPTWWFLLLGAVFSGYAILDGFDLGAGAWHLFFKKEESRRIALNAIGPVWDGNEVWLVIAGGAMFAGFPVLYASVFSAMYIPFMLFLAFLIFRAVSIEFRSKEAMKWWRKTWDISYISISMMMILVAIELFPVLMNSKIDPAYSITIQNVGSSDKSLGIMLGFAAIGVPLVGLYTFFVYRTFWGKVKLDESSY